MAYRTPVAPEPDPPARPKLSLPIWVKTVLAVLMVAASVGVFLLGSYLGVGTYVALVFKIVCVVLWFVMAACLVAAPSYAAWALARHGYRLWKWRRSR